MNNRNSQKPDADAAGPPATKGGASRAAILLTAAKLATTRGLAGLSIGDLAAEVGMSKSGLYAHFKSKEELELATIETAAAIFDREVLQIAMQAPAGSGRLRALVGAFLSHLERRVFPGGCFFASAASELDTRPGPARDRVVEMLDGWLGLMGQCVREARELGEIDPYADVAQAVFEIESMMVGANFLFVLTNDPVRLAHARAGVDNVIARLAPKAAPAKKRVGKK